MPCLSQVDSQRWIIYPHVQSLAHVHVFYSVINRSTIYHPN